jgi:hypothetical protein
LAWVVDGSRLLIFYHKPNTRTIIYSTNKNLCKKKCFEHFDQNDSTQCVLPVYLLQTQT